MWHLRGLSAAEYVLIENFHLSYSFTVRSTSQGFWYLQGLLQIKETIEKCPQFIDYESLLKAVLK